jgi:hypothetical protein
MPKKEGVGFLGITRGISPVAAGSNPALGIF